LILHGLTYKLEHDFFEFHTRTPSSFLLLDHIIFILQNDDLDANTQGISLSSWHPTLNPTHGLQEIPMEKPFKYNSIKPLVHRDCH
jgi:hypothetical protein